MHTIFYSTHPHAAQIPYARINQYFKILSSLSLVNLGTAFLHLYFFFSMNFPTSNSLIRGVCFKTPLLPNCLCPVLCGRAILQWAYFITSVLALSRCPGRWRMRQRDILLCWLWCCSLLWCCVGVQCWLCLAGGIQYSLSGSTPEIARLCDTVCEDSPGGTNSRLLTRHHRFSCKSPGGVSSVSRTDTQRALTGVIWPLESKIYT